MEDVLNDLQTDLAHAASSPAIYDIERRYLGSKGKIKLLLKTLGTLSPDKRVIQGQALNKLQQEAQVLITNARANAAAKERETEINTSAETLNFSIPKIGHLHPITQTIRDLNAAFREMGYSIMDGPEIETDEFCLQRLNVPEDHPARDMQDTIYIKEPTWLLRSQTSSIEARTLAQYSPPLKVVMPGKVYRNEKVNRSNHFIFHQYQGLVVLPQVSLKDLFGTFTYLFKKMYGEDVHIRFRSKYYPEVEPGAGPDMQCFNCHGKGCPICKYIGWIEMGGSGIVHPKVLSMAGIDPNKYKGFAFGLGLDRWVMAKYHITDIRSLMGGEIAYSYYTHENTLL